MKPWPKGDRVQALESANAFVLLMRMAVEKSSGGDTTCWGLTWLAHLIAERMVVNIPDDQLDSGHVADDATKCQWLLLGAKAVDDANDDDRARLDAALLILRDVARSTGFPNGEAQR